MLSTSLLTVCWHAARSPVAAVVVVTGKVGAGFAVVEELWLLVDEQAAAVSASAASARAANFGVGRMWSPSVVQVFDNATEAQEHSQPR